jgi:hypothetical protein
MEQTLHKRIEEIPYLQLEKLPLGCRKAFEMSIIRFEEIEFLMASPIEKMNLTELRKMRIRLERYTGYRCAFYLKEVNWYAAPKLVEEGIPFVWEGHQVYLPFLGLLLKENEGRTLKNCTNISFLTQKLILKALYENWKDVSAVKAAEFLNVSRMSITRCYDEIEALEMPFLKTLRRSRRFYAMDERKKMWEIVRPYMRNPVIRSFKLKEKPIAEMVLSGISALAEYSMLEEDNCRIYAVCKEQIRNLGIKDIREVYVDEEPACIIQEVGYLLPFRNFNAVDPLSLNLIITDSELEDPRIKISINEMMEEFVW